MCSRTSLSMSDDVQQYQNTKKYNSVGDPLHTCDLSRSGVNLPIWLLPLSPPDEAAKIPIFMNSDFRFCQKLKLVFRSPQSLALSNLNLPQKATVDLYWFSATGKSMYRLSSVNKNQHIFKNLIGCSGCTN